MIFLCLLRNNENIEAEIAAVAKKLHSNDGFDSRWEPLCNEFPHSQHLLACGLATVFPGTTLRKS